MSRISSLYDAYLRKAPRQSRSRSVVEAILSAAAEKLSGARDEEEVTLQDVANRAGVGVGSLYDYFRDRRSLLSALAAKLTEDNLRAFDELLTQIETLPMEEAVSRLVDFCFATFSTNKGMSRTILKIGHSIGLMPTLAQSQTVFAESLAASLRKRSDVDDVDVDLMAWTVTQAMMGVVCTLVWQDQPTYSHEKLRGELVRLFASHLSRDARARLRSA